MRVGFSGAGDQAVIVFISALLVLFFSACSRSAEEVPIMPPATPPLNREYIGFAVVNVSFAHLLNEPGGISQGYLRRGTVVRILERRIDRVNSESWVLTEGNFRGPGAVSRGWLQEAAVDIFDNESRAITASKAMIL